MREGWVETTLGKVADWSAGGTPVSTNAGFYSDGTIPWAVIADVRNSPITETARHLTEDGLASIGGVQKVAPVGSVLLTMYGSVGRSAIARVPMATNQAIAWAVPNENKISSEYLFFFLRSQEGQFDSLARGATQRNINKGIVTGFPLSLPPLAEQRRIVDLIGSLDEAIEAADGSESLAGTAYSAMAAGLKGPLTPLSAILEKIEAGKSPSGEERQPLTDERAVLKVSAIGANGFNSNEVKTVAPNVELSSSTCITSGDLLMVRANGVLSRVGAVCLVPAVGDRYYLSDKTLRLVSKPNLVAPNWLLAALRAPGVRHQIAQLTGGSDMRNITQKAILELRIPCPNLDVQAPASELLEALVDTATASRDHGLSLRTLRTNLLTALLSGTHKIPESYDELLAEAV